MSKTVKTSLITFSVLIFWMFTGIFSSDDKGSNSIIEIEGNNAINNSVIKAIRNSTMSTFNPKEEVVLAKKLLKLHPWAGGVKFARTGGEANALSLRIARSFVKKTKIAI